MNLKHTALVLLFFICFTGCMSVQPNQPVDDSKGFALNTNPEPVAGSGTGGSSGRRNTPPEPQAGNNVPADASRDRSVSTAAETAATAADGGAQPSPTRAATAAAAAAGSAAAGERPRPGASEEFVPVTLEIVNYILNLIRNSPNPQVIDNELKTLRFSLSKPVSITPIRNNAQVGRGGVSASGALIMGGQSVSPSPSGSPLVIDRNASGVLFTIGSDVIVVIFDRHQLSFRKNSQGRYDLFSAVFGVEANSLRYEGSPPQLRILIQESNIRQEILAIPDSASGGSQRRNDNVHQPEYRGNDWPYQATNISYSFNQYGPSRNITDRGSLTRRGIIEYVIRQNPSVDRARLNSLIDTYICEAEIEGINHDIAIAQMLYTTNNLSNARMTTRNYGGLSTNGIRWDGSFCDMDTGVRAHIQHLKGYASRAPLNRPCVDPRFQILANLGYRGTVRTFDDLYRRWTENSNYGNSIEVILHGLYRFSAGY